jgi:hypothetical protein
MDGVLASLPPINRLHKRFWFFFAFHSSSLSLSHSSRNYDKTPAKGESVETKNKKEK